MHLDEVWQVYDANGEAVAGEGWEARLENPEVSGSDAIVGVAVVFLFRVHEGQLELLWQRRSDTIDRYPGDYDISAGGHINLGETPVMGAIRETREEIGAEITAQDLWYVTERAFNRNRFAWIYAVNWTEREEEFRFDDKEVSEVKWVPWSETDAFRLRYAKEPLKRDHLTFAALEEWFRMYGYL